MPAGSASIRRRQRGISGSAAAGELSEAGSSAAGVTPAPFDAAAGGACWGGFPEAGRIGHVHLQVGDTGAADRFYRDLLGFEVTARYPGASFYGSGGYHHHLGFNTWRGEGVPAVPAGAIGLGHWTVRIGADSLAELRGRLEAAGWPFEELPDGGLLVRDPWGIAVVFESQAS